MKKIIKILILLIFMSACFTRLAEAQPYQFAFSNDGVNWVQDYAPIPSQPTLFMNYRNPTITGVGGDTLWFKLLDSAGVFVDVEYFKVYNISPGYLVDSICDSVAFIVLLDSVGNGREIFAYNNADIEYSPLTPQASMYYSKFNNPNVVITGGNKSTIQGIDSALISLADFGMEYNTQMGADEAFCSQVCWYRNDTLVVCGIDTFLTVYTTGIYSVEAEITRKTKMLDDSCIFSRWYDSDTVSVEIISTVSVEYFSNENSFNIYPNPVVEYLYFSDEVEYVVYSLSGQEMIRGEGKEVDVREFESGVYVLSTPLGNRKFRVE